MAKHGFWLILVVLLLSACGGNAAATLPSAQQAETALADMPLPQSEETLLAELPALETGYPTEIAATTPTITMDALQAPIYTDIALPEDIAPTLTSTLIPTLIPTLTPPQSVDLGQAPAATGLIPTLGSPSGGSQVLLPLIISDSLVQVEQAPVPLVEEVAQPNEVIIESRSTPVPSAGLGRFFLPGLLCLMGIIILGLGIYMNTTSQPTGQEITAVLNIADLKPGLGLVELKGTITQVPRPLDKNVDNPLALMRLVIEENEPQVGWKVVLDRVLTTEFSLEDGTGAVWVAPDQLDLNLLGEGSFASIKQAEEALKILGLTGQLSLGQGIALPHLGAAQGAVSDSPGQYPTAVQLNWLLPAADRPVPCYHVRPGPCQRRFRQSRRQHIVHPGHRAGRRCLLRRPGLAIMGANALTDRSRLYLSQTKGRKYFPV